MIPETSWEQKVDDIAKYDCDIFGIGDDWKGKFDFLKEHCEVIYLPRTDGISTTELKRSLNRFLSVSKDDMNFAFGIIEQLKNDLA